MAEKDKSVEKVKMSASEAFTNKVMAEFAGKTSDKLELTDYQRNLIQGYFIGIDRMLKKAEEDRKAKNDRNRDHKYDNDLPITWSNVNLTDVALDVVHYSRLGLDMLQKNNINAIPFKDNSASRYDIAFIKGYVGIELEAKKYALEVPKSVTCELVYSNDKFSAKKRSGGQGVEDYTFEIPQPFDRGVIVGGFGYIEYEDPHKNKLVIMTLREILKRKPKYAAAEFWGGEKDIWDHGKKTGEKEKVEGWYDEMCLKTLKRYVYSESNIPRDPQKIDDDYQRIRMREAEYQDAEAKKEIEEHANKVPLEPDFSEIDTETGEVKEPAPEAAQEEKPKAKVPEKDEAAEQTTLDAPGF